MLYYVSLVSNGIATRQLCENARFGEDCTCLWMSKLRFQTAPGCFLPIIRASFPWLVKETPSCLSITLA